MAYPSTIENQLNPTGARTYSRNRAQQAFDVFARSQQPQVQMQSTLPPAQPPGGQFISENPPNIEGELAAALNNAPDRAPGLAALLGSMQPPEQPESGLDLRSILKARGIPTSEQFGNIPLTEAPRLLGTMPGAAQPEPFNLSPGQARFSGTGQQIAQLPAVEKAVAQLGLQLIETVDREGKPVRRFVKPEEGAAFPIPQTPEKKEATSKIVGFVQNLKGISERLINKKLALQQRVGSSARAVEAALANDPDYRVYQDLRTALAAAMGTAEQGSRISDYDVRGVYLPMVPDIFSDTSESAPRKWEIIEERFGVGVPGLRPTKSSGGPTVGAVEDGYRFKGGNPADPNNWEKVQ